MAGRGAARSCSSSSSSGAPSSTTRCRSPSSPPSEYQAEIQAEATTDDTTAEDAALQDASEGQLRALGLLDPSTDLQDAVAQLFGGGTLAYYDTEADEVKVLGTELDVAHRVTLVHELTHAWQDQQGYLDELDDLEDGQAYTLQAISLSNQITLGAISGLTATAAGSAKINLSWTAVSKALGYNIYRSTDPNGTFTKINSAPVAAASYSDTGLNPNTIYYYQVGVSGGSTSATVSAATGGTGVPALDASSYTLMVNDTHNTVLTVMYPDRSTQDLTSQASYSSSNTAVATVDTAGVVSAVSAVHLRLQPPITDRLTLLPYKSLPIRT